MILQIYTIIQTLISLIAIFTGIVSISLLCDPLPFFSGRVGRILIRACAPSLLALRRLFSKGIDLGKITWRELEEIVGELLSLEGYDVEVGRGTKDNGIDVLASKILPHVGLLRTVWQVKHLKAGNKVALKTIRELADIRDQAGATKGVIVTTGFLTSGALRRIRQDAYRLEKIEGPELEDWIRRSLSGAA
jgi:hypothetical protein